MLYVTRYLLEESGLKYEAQIYVLNSCWIGMGGYAAVREGVNHNLGCAHLGRGGTLQCTQVYYDEALFDLRHSTSVWVSHDEPWTNHRSTKSICLNKNLIASKSSEQSKSLGGNNIGYNNNYS